jgi:hypothetical protein
MLLPLLPAASPTASTTLSTATPSASSSPPSSLLPSPVTADSASALPSWLLVALLILVAAVIVAMFGLTLYNLSAPRSTLKNLLGLRRKYRGSTGGNHVPVDRLVQLAGDENKYIVSQRVVDTLSLSARVGTRTTRTTLAITGFSLLGVIVIAVFGLSGEGVRDLRTQLIAAVSTLVAAIAGFYFGAQTAGKNSAIPPGSRGDSSTKAVPKPDITPPHFIIDQPGIYVPPLARSGPVSAVGDKLPAGLTLDPASGVIFGTPAPGTAGEYALALTAGNGTGPDSTLHITLTVAEPAMPAPADAGKPTAARPPQLASTPHAHAGFTVGEHGVYTPDLAGSPQPTITATGDPLPPSLTLDPATGTISGVPAAGTVGDYNLILTASNGVEPAATLPVQLTITDN